ncbi:MAG: hypothetical protein JO306_02820 [Gemmatimonadetes bacterium]|nr:hypothetical protein [Gemmatimonadota bacterium]
MKKRPLGMVIIGMLAGFAGLAFCFVLSMLDPSGPPGMLMELRAGVAILAVLAFVAAEALIFVRPWFYRAAMAFAVAWFLAVAALVMTANGLSEFIRTALYLMVPSFVVIAPIMAYLGEKNRLMPRHPRAFIRVPRPRGTP